MLLPSSFGDCPVENVWVFINKMEKTASVVALSGGERCGVPTSTGAMITAHGRGVERHSPAALDGASASPGGQGGQQEGCVTPAGHPVAPAVLPLEGSKPPLPGCHVWAGLARQDKAGQPSSPCPPTSDGQCAPGAPRGCCPGTCGEPHQPGPAAREAPTCDGGALMGDAVREGA